MYNVKTVGVFWVYLKLHPLVVGSSSNFCHRTLVYRLKRRIGEQDARYVWVESYVFL